jgi:putative hydrolase of the HAD superfamily
VVCAPCNTLRVVSAVVFDWGGTVTTYVHVDPVLAWTSAARCLAPQEPDRLCDTLTRAEAALWSAVVTDPRSGTLAALLAGAVAELGLSVTDAQLDQAQAQYLDGWSAHVEHRPDAAVTLRALRDRGLKIGLLSNTLFPAAFHEELLARDGLLDLIDVRHYTSGGQWMKPHPEPFARVLRELGIADPRSVVFVGDRLHDDIYGAQRAGLRTVHIANASVPAYDVEPDGRIEILTELLALVDAWM